MSLPTDLNKSHIGSIEFLYIDGNQTGISDTHNVPGFKIAGIEIKDQQGIYTTRILTESLAIFEPKREKL